MVGHRTESIYRRYTIADEAMLKEGAIKLAAFHASEKNGTPKVVPIEERKAVMFCPQLSATCAYYEDRLGFAVLIVKISEPDPGTAISLCARVQQ